ncbi:MAG: hypothetical protein MZW92_24575 [Comamonadaceae bacterium]|nr:hypothetical protein [Comamonadaceae bacterium]
MPRGHAASRRQRAAAGRDGARRANVQFVLKGIGTEIGGIAAVAAALARLDFKVAGFIGDEMKADAKAAREEFDALERRFMQIGRALPCRPTTATRAATRAASIAYGVGTGHRLGRASAAARAARRPGGLHGSDAR